METSQILVSGKNRFNNAVLVLYNKFSTLKRLFSLLRERERRSCSSQVMQIFAYIYIYVKKNVIPNLCLVFDHHFHASIRKAPWVLIKAAQVDGLGLRCT